MDVRDRNGVEIGPGDRVLFRGDVRRVVALYRDSSDGSQVSLERPAGHPAGLSVATVEVRARASDLTLVRP